MIEKKSADLETRALGKRFSIGSRFSAEGKRTVHAVDNVSLTVGHGETVGLVGESGCGKSTLARCLVRLYDISEGQLIFEGEDITGTSLAKLRPLRRPAADGVPGSIGFAQPEAARRRSGGGAAAHPHQTVVGADRQARG